MPKRIPKSKIMQHFFDLPEEDRFRILRQNLDPSLIDKEAGNQFYTPIVNLRSKSKEETLAFIRKYYGDSPEHLKTAVEHGELLLGNYKDSEYAKYHAQTDEEKLYAQIHGETLVHRLRIYYDELNEAGKEDFIREALRKMCTIEAAARTLEDPTSYAKGKSPESLLEDVKKTMNLDAERSVMDYIRNGIPADDPERNEKLHWIAKQYMIFAESSLEPEELCNKLKEEDWRKKFDIQETLREQDDYSRISAGKLLPRMKEALDDIPETDEEKTLFREAALQVCKDYAALKRMTADTDDPDKQEFLKFINELQEGLVTDGLKKKENQDLRDNLAKEYATLQKEKSGWFLSKTNSPEYNNMMKHLKLFYAKMDMLSGKPLQESLTAEEQKILDETNVDVLLANAKQGCYNYGTLKTKNGTGSIWHDAGSERFDSSMNTLSQLSELGKKLHLSDPATAVRDEAQVQALQHRSDSKWLKNNIEDVVAKTICAQVLLGKKTPADEQSAKLEGSALAEQVEKIKSSSRFQTMMKMAKPEQLADAVIKGGTGLHELYNQADKAAKKDGRERTASEIEPDSLKPDKKSEGLVPGYNR